MAAVIAIASLAAQTPAPAATTAAPIPRYDVKRAGSPLTVVGKLDDASYHKPASKVLIESK